MAWGPSMLCKPFMVVLIRFRVLARCHPFRFGMLHQTWENPKTVNRARQPAAK